MKFKSGYGPKAGSTCKRQCPYNKDTSVKAEMVALLRIDYDMPIYRYVTLLKIQKPSKSSNN